MFFSSFDLIGRSKIRKIFSFSRFLVEDEFDFDDSNPYFFIITNKDQIQINSFNNYHNEELKIFQDELNKELELVNLMNIIEEEDYSEISEEDNLLETNDSNEIIDYHDQLKTINDLCNNINFIEISHLFLKKNLNTFGTNEEHFRETVKFYFNYIVNPLTSHNQPIYSVKDSLLFWKLISANPINEAICDLAHRILVTPASEASCESYFSKQKKIIKIHGYRSSKKFVNSKLIFKWF